MMIIYYPTEKGNHKPIPAKLAHLHWSSGHDFRLSRVCHSRQARETGVRFPDGELPLLSFPFAACLFFSYDYVAAAFPFG